MARSAEDVGLAFEALASTPVPETSTLRRIGVATNFAGNEEIASAFVAVVANLAAMGIETRQVEVPFHKASFDPTNVQRDGTRIDALLFGEVDAIVLPTLTAPTPTVEEARRRGDMAVSPDNTFFCNCFGLPAVSVPMGPDKNGLPLGVQFVGPHDNDQSLLAFARAYQRAAGWRIRATVFPGRKRSCLTLGVPLDGAGAPRLVQNGLEFPACCISTGLS